MVVLVKGLTWEKDGEVRIMHKKFGGHLRWFKGGKSCFTGCCLTDL